MCTGVSRECWRHRMDGMDSRQFLEKTKEAEASLREAVRLVRGGIPVVTQLASRVSELSGSLSAGLYCRRGGTLERIGGAGALDLLPAALPVGGNRFLPWERALGKREPVHVDSALMSVLSGSEAGLPPLACSFIPLGSEESVQGLWVQCGVPPAVSDESSRREWNGINQLAMMAMELWVLQQGRSREEASLRWREEKTLHRERLVSLGQLLSNVVHELNNPLTAISGYAQLLLQEQPLDSVRETAVQLHRESDRATRIVRNLLSFAAEDGDSQQLVSLDRLVESVLELREYELKLKNIQVRRNWGSDLPRVAGNPHQLEQAFLNLVLNAEQAMQSQRDGGVLTLTLARMEDGIKCVVADDGPGIPPEVLPRVFDPFFTTKPAGEGTGLGLAIARAAVQEHGGTIRAENLPGRGVEFVIELPAARPGKEETLAPPKDAALAPPRVLQGRVLVVDDEPTVAGLIAEVLEQGGCRVRVFTDSEEALEAALREPFDLIICDIRMPGLSAPAFYRALRKRKPELARRLLLTTGDTLARNTQQFVDKIGLPVLRKPFKVDELRAAAGSLLAKAGN